MPSTYLEPPATGTGRLDPGELVAACFERDSSALLLDDGALPATFFDLSSGVAGELLQRLVNYGIRMAAVVPDPSIHSQPFQDFARETGANGAIRFFRTRAEAVRWLESLD